MTIGIDIRVLGNPIKSGIEEYAESLFPNLIKEGKDISFKFFYSSLNKNLANYDWLQQSNVKLYKFNYPNNVVFTSSRFFNRPFIDKMVGGADVFFFPHFFLSSLSPKCKRVTTFHDLSYIRFPEFLTLRKKMWHRLQMVPHWQAKFSDKIISVSESTKRDIINYYNIDPAKIKVIYSGIDSKMEIVSKENLGDFKRRKKLPDRFIFFLGKLEPRKNIPNLIKVFNELKIKPENRDLGLVIGGAKGWSCYEIFKELERSHYKNQIIFTGNIIDEEKKFYYSAADIFVYPSFFEGFGFPPLEAMSCGAPVIVSRNSSFSEIVEDAAVMIDPHNIRETEMWITKLLNDKKLKDSMIKKGIEQSAKFKWKNTAVQTLDALINA